MCLEILEPSIKTFFHFMSPCLSWKVKALREELGMPFDENEIHRDGYGMKILFNHGLRRFGQASSTRVTWLNITSFLFEGIQSFH